MLQKVTACLPFTLLGSLPIALQFNVAHPRSSNLAKDQQTASSISNKEGLVDTQPERSPELSYRRFNTYEHRRRSARGSLTSTDSSGNAVSGKISLGRVWPGSAPTSVVLINGEWAEVRETERGRGKKRASDPSVAKRCMSEPLEWALFDDDHVAPFRPQSLKRRSGSASPFAGSSTASPSLEADIQSSVFPLSPSLETLEEEKRRELLELSSPEVISSLSALGIIVEGAEPLKFPDTPTGSAMLNPYRRVSFSSASSSVRSFPEDASELSSPAESCTSWGSYFTPDQSPILTQPPLARQNWLPSKRSNAAGRSIMTHTNTFSDSFENEESEILQATGVPMHNKVIIRSLQRPTSSVANLSPLQRRETNGEETPNATPKFNHAYLPQTPPESPETEHEYTNTRASPITTKSRKRATPPTNSTPVTPPYTPEMGSSSPSSTQDDRRVRHWSMDGSEWRRKSGEAGSGAMDAEDGFSLVCTSGGAVVQPQEC